MWPRSGSFKIRGIGHLVQVVYRNMYLSQGESGRWNLRHAEVRKARVLTWDRPFSARSQYRARSPSLGLDKIAMKWATYMDFRKV